MNENNITRLNVTMYQALAVQLRHAAAHVESQPQTICGRQSLQTLNIITQRPWLVRFGIRVDVIRQFHDIVKVGLRVIPPDVEQMNQTVRAARQWFVALNAGELA